MQVKKDGMMVEYLLWDVSNIVKSVLKYFIAENFRFVLLVGIRFFAIFAERFLKHRLGRLERFAAKS